MNNQKAVVKELFTINEIKEGKLTELIEKNNPGIHPDDAIIIIMPTLPFLLSKKPMPFEYNGSAFSFIPPQKDQQADHHT